jgi:SAF domain
MHSLTEARPVLSRLRRGWRAVRRQVLARRRPLAALLAGLAVAAGVRAAVGPPEPVVPVLVATHDLAAGLALAPGDVAIVGFAPGTEPGGLVENPAGRTLAAPLRRGEPVTDVRLVGPRLTDGYPGLVAAPVRLPDEAAAALLTVGDRIDLVAADPRGGTPRDLALDVPVLAVPPGTGEGQIGGRLVVLGIPPLARHDLAEAAVREFLTFTFSR